MKILTFLLLLCLVITQVLAQNAEAQQKMSKMDKHYFIENKGQWHSDVLYLCRMGGLDAWITKYGVNYTFYKVERTTSIPAGHSNTSIPAGDKFHHDDLENSTLLGHRVLLKLQNHNPAPQREGKQKQVGYYNYLIGNDPSKHASNVGLYKEAVVKNVYNGIDLRYYFDKGSLRYDYVVHPGADPSKIAFTLEGQNDAYIKNDNLYFTTRFGEVAMAELHTYQGKNTVASRFEKQGNTWKIAVGNYDRTQDLIIDPLIYSTYIGGSDSEWANDIGVDGSGNAYVTGWTQSTNYDITAGAFQTTPNGGSYYVFVTKLNSIGTALIYSTYIGGSSDEEGYDLAIDVSGNTYITGYTLSINYDITAGAFQMTNGGNYDVFVTKLNSTGTALIYSTYIGGSNNDFGYSIAIDGSGNVYVSGMTLSTNYDITPGAFQTTKGGVYDVFVTKLNSTGTALVYSTYIGGSGDEEGFGIAIDVSGNAYITGYTSSTNYDITAGAFQTTRGGGYDVFVTKLNSTGTALVYSTYIGGSSDEEGFDIAIDASGNAYITGSTFSTNYDITAGAFQTTKGGSYDVFVTKLNSTGTGLVYSTYIGGSNNDFGRSIAINVSGNVFITGYTTSSNYDIIAGAFQTTNGGGSDLFVTKLNSTGTALVYSTYIGGSNQDIGYSIAIDGNGNAYVSGYTQSTNYDITAGVFQTTYGGGSYDVFVTKLCPDVSCTPLPVTLLSFEAFVDNSSKVRFEWATATENNTNYFAIERSVNGVDFETITTQKGAKNSSTTLFYQTYDESPYKGVSYYRLKQVDNDGSYSYSQIRAVNIDMGEDSWKVYPNPNNGTFILQSEKPAIFELTDITGKLINTFHTQGTALQVNENLPAGMYFVREKETAAVQKLIVR